MTTRLELLKAFATSVIVFTALSLVSSPANAQGAGQQVYKTKCASCHGPDGAGATPAGKATKARDICSEDVKKETDDELTAIVVKGKNKMPGYDKKLTDAEIKNVVAYLRGLCKK